MTLINHESGNRKLRNLIRMMRAFGALLRRIRILRKSQLKIKSISIFLKIFHNCDAFLKYMAKSLRWPSKKLD